MGTTFGIYLCLLKIFHLLAAVALCFLPLCLSYSSSDNFPFFLASLFFFLSVIPFPSLPICSSPLHIITIVCLLDKYPMVGGWKYLFLSLNSLAREVEQEPTLAEVKPCKIYKVGLSLVACVCMCECVNVNLVIGLSIELSLSCDRTNL